MVPLLFIFHYLNENYLRMRNTVWDSQEGSPPPILLVDKFYNNLISFICRSIISCSTIQKICNFYRWKSPTLMKVLTKSPVFSFSVPGLTDHLGLCRTMRIQYLTKTCQKWQNLHFPLWKICYWLNLERVARVLSLPDGRFMDAISRDKQTAVCNHLGSH